MQGASRTAYVVAEEKLDELAATANPEQLRTVGDEILAVAALLAGDVQLRRALSDPARPREDRVGLLRDLLGSRVSDTAMAALEALVSGRWPSPSELLDGCERLGVQALLASAERAGVLSEVEDELFRFAQTVAGDSELGAAVGDTRVPAERRATLVEDLVGGRVADVTLRLIRVALGGFGGRNVPTALTRLVELAAQRQDRNVAYVTVAAPLAPAEEQRLGAALAARYGREVSLKTTVDPRVLGGVRVRVGADLYDGTIARRLAQARTALASG